MKRNHPMENNKKFCNCKKDGINNIECKCDDNNSTSDDEKSLFKKKRFKLFNYIKSSYRSIKRWLDRSNAPKTPNKSTFIINDNFHNLTKSTFSCQETKKVVYNFSKDSNKNVSHNNHTSFVELHAYNHKFTTDIINSGQNQTFNARNSCIDLTKMIQNSTYKELECILDKTNVGSFAVYNHGSYNNNNSSTLMSSWCSNSFLLRSSKALLPRQNFPTLKSNKIINNSIIYDDLVTKSSNFLVDHKNRKNQIDMLPSKCVESNLDIQSSFISSEIKPYDCEEMQKTPNLGFTKDYYDLKITALCAATSNQYHEKEKQFILQRIKDHQEKRTKLKKQYESLFPDFYIASHKDSMPKLDQNLLKKYIECIKNNSTNGYEIKLPNDAITCKDLSTLLGMNWLNDEVINFYLNMIMIRSQSSDKSYPSVHTFNTFFYEKLSRNGYIGVKRWTKKVNIFEKRFVLIPIHLAVHWCMCVVDMHEHTINYYDSLLNPNYDCINIIKDYLSNEFNTRYSKPIDLTSWKFDCPTNIPIQRNGSDCGVFACVFSEYISRISPFDFTQENMPYFRQKMIIEIFQNKLLFH